MTLPGHELMPLVRDALARGQHVRLTVNGCSMWPIIRDGDVVELVPCSAAPKRGDIVLAETAPDRYVVHRVVRVGNEGIWLRGDAQTLREGPIATRNALGVATLTTRAGRSRPIDRGIIRCAGLVCMRCAPLVTRLCKANMWLRTFGARALGRMQRSSLLRALLHRFRPAIVIQEATPEELAFVDPWLDLPDAHMPPTAPKGLTNYIAKRGTQVLGLVRLISSPADAGPRAGYWLYSLAVRTRYRGMGIGERLTRHVIEQANAAGACELFLTVFEDNYPARSLYEKLGFEHVTIPALEVELADDVERYGHQRIPMRKRLP